MSLFGSSTSEGSGSTGADPVPEAVGLEGKLFSGAEIYQGHFQTAMVKVVVGRGLYPRTFYAHEGILSKSAFFERALNGGFKESITRKVELPDDEPVVFSSVLEYLYGEEYSPKLVTRERPGVQQVHGPQFGSNTGGLFGAGSLSYSPPPRTEIVSKVISGYQNAGEKPAERGAAALRHAKIYCLADKLGLEGLQKLVLEKLCLCGPVKDVHFIKVAAYLVENSSDTRGVLSAFLSPYVQGIPKPS